MNWRFSSGFAAAGEKLFSPSVLDLSELYVVFNELSKLIAPATPQADFTGNPLALANHTYFFWFFAIQVLPICNSALLPVQLSGKATQISTSCDRLAQYVK